MYKIPFLTISQEHNVINGISFTRREMDVMAILVSGRGSKTAAMLLNLSPRTIETHMYNIMQKSQLQLKYASREGLIDFLEQNNLMVTFRRHYDNLLLENTFTRTLKDINSVVGSYNAGYNIIIEGSFDEESFLLKRLTSDLHSAGIIKSEKNKNINIVLSSPEKISAKGVNSINIGAYESYYHIYFAVLKRIFTNKSIKIVENNFLEKYKDFQQGINTFPILQATLSKSTNSLKQKIHKSILAIILLSIVPMYLVFNYGIGNRNTSQGSINSAIYSTSTLSQPWNIPHLSTHFIKRVEARNKIMKKFHDDSVKKDYKTLNQAALVGLYGLGGVGKTYLALDIINNPDPEKNYSFRGWFTANDENKLKADYIKLGSELRLFSEDMEEDQKLAIVRNWLDSQESILLVFDNAPDMETIEKYLPSNGDIVVTSRNYKIPNPIEVDRMSESESIELLGNLVHISNNKPELAILVKQLGYLPLAIAQAGAYIDQNQITVEKYQELYKKEQNVLMTENVMPVSDRHSSVYITWNCTLKEIRKKDKTGKAIELLNLISFCHSVNIPKSLLMKYLYGTADNKFEIEFNKITGLLRQYSLIKASSDALTIHHLVQDCIRSNLTMIEQKTILKRAINIVRRIYPLENKKADDYEFIKMLLPHMTSLSEHKKQMDLQDIVDLETYIADTYYELGDYNKAISLFQEVLNLQEKYYGVNSLHVANTLIYLAQLEHKINNNKNALLLVERSISIFKNYPNPKLNMKNVSIQKANGLRHKILK